MIQPLQAAMFDDVPNDYWARQYIEDLVAKNYMSGYGEGLFGPNNNLTRAETVKIILNALEKPIGEYSSASFKDVPNEHSLLNYIESAKDQSIVLGYEDGTFKPDRPVTRAEFMKILLEASGEVMNDPQVSQPFSDVPDDSWYRKYVYSALLKGYSQGYGNGKFGPNNNITRAEASKIISVFLKGGTPYVAEATDSEKKVLELINASRAAANKPALELDPKLSAIARYHSQDLYDIYHFWTKEVKQKYLSDHPGEAIPWTQHKDSSGRPFGEWFADKAAYYDFDYAKANQNIGFAFYDNKSVDELLTSIHDQMMKYDQANTILGTNDNYTHVGIGVLVGEDPNEIYLTEIFITR
jgi:uncharacterized protein YkwD